MLKLPCCDTQAATVLAPARLTFRYSSCIPEQVSAYLPQEPIGKRGDERVTFGRNENSDVRLNDEKMSREYLQVWLEGGGEQAVFRVKNTSSVKCVLLDRRKLKPQEETVLENNVKLRLDRLEFLVELDYGEEGGGFEIEFRAFEVPTEQARPDTTATCRPCPETGTNGASSGLPHSNGTTSYSWPSDTDTASGSLRTDIGAASFGMRMRHEPATPMGGGLLELSATPDGKQSNTSPTGRTPPTVQYRQNLACSPGGEVAAPKSYNSDKDLLNNLNIKWPSSAAADRRSSYDWYKTSSIKCKTCDRLVREPGKLKNGEDDKVLNIDNTEFCSCRSGPVEHSE